MSNEYFKFKRFTVRHDRCAMKVGTDGVLLGAWAPLGMRMLDIGTGTGLIALMAAQRSEHSCIDAVEIDDDAACQASDNAKASGFGERINIFHTSLQEFADGGDTPRGPYDSIVSNPPFYTEDTACPEARRHAARHTQSLSYGCLFDCAARLLSEDGTFSLIVPCEAREKIMFEACIAGLYVKNICYVRTTPRKQPKRMLVTFSNVRHDDVCTEERCMMNADGSRSEWYVNLTRDFYL